jgi:hypothetical protein
MIKLELVGEVVDDEESQAVDSPRCGGCDEEDFERTIAREEIVPTIKYRWARWGPRPEQSYCDWCWVNVYMREIDFMAPETIKVSMMGEAFKEEIN